VKHEKTNLQMVRASLGAGNVASFSNRADQVPHGHMFLLRSPIKLALLNALEKERANAHRI